MAKDDVVEAQEVESTNYEGLEKQVQAEYTLAFNFNKPKRDDWTLRLKLYNNQKRDKDAAGDTTLFTIFQTVLASLYIDKLTTEWSGREEGDEETAENLNGLSKFDYDEMGKDELDYEWDWDTLFFGRGLCMMSEYIRDPEKNIFVPAPEIWDPMTFLRDPRAASVNGNRLLGRNNARFFGREIRMTKLDMKDNPNFLDIDFRTMKYGLTTNSLVDAAVQARADAQNLTDQSKLTKESLLGDNAEYCLTDWFTHWKGKPVRVWLANDRKKVVGYKELKKDSQWPLIDRALYPTAHDWDGTSLPDILEDKQRLRAVAQNLGIKAMTADLYPMYIYDQNKIKNKHDLDFGFNKFIPSDGAAGDAVLPLRKSMPNLNLLDFIYQSLDASAQKATATSDIQQGAIASQQRTLGEINLISQKTETRYGLSAKVFGWSEKRFWLQWYQLYKENFADKIDEKVVRVVGAFGAKWRPLQKNDIITKRLDPDVAIESQEVSRAKQLEERQALGTLFSVLVQDPTANIRYGQKRLARVYGLEKDEIERLLPPTIDEMVADDENENLSKNKFVQVRGEDNHNVHLEIHAKAGETKSKEAHVATHKKALVMQKKNPELFPVQQQQQEQAMMQQQAETGKGSPPKAGLGMATPGAGSAFASKPVTQGATSGQVTPTM